jgi:hypothetical protein
LLGLLICFNIQHLEVCIILYSLIEGVGKFISSSNSICIELFVIIHLN